MAEEKLNKAKSISYEREKIHELEKDVKELRDSISNHSVWQGMGITYSLMNHSTSKCVAVDISHQRLRDWMLDSLLKYSNILHEEDMTLKAEFENYNLGGSC